MCTGNQNLHHTFLFLRKRKQGGGGESPSARGEGPLVNSKNETRDSNRENFYQKGASGEGGGVV